LHWLRQPFSKSIGEGGIRTLDTRVNPYDGLANRCSLGTEPDSIRPYDEPEKTLPTGLPIFSDNDPDLAAVVEAWDRLPEPIRAGIVAMVRAMAVQIER